MNMRRRNFLRVCVFGALAGCLPCLPAGAQSELTYFALQEGPYDLHIRDYLSKIRNFDQPHEDDVHLSAADFGLLTQCMQRFRRLIRTVGYANFSLLGVDEAVRVARQYPAVGGFSSEELEFLEAQFYADAALYGFYGEKPLASLTDTIARKNVVKVPRSGNYIFRGDPEKTWKRIRVELGRDVVLTSGVRGVIKQFYLFFRKTQQSEGNVSLASRSLAPPGYSFHGVGDFDVGKRGFGEANFTEQFTGTSVYARLVKLGYLTLRYPQDNTFGVRFEPWHVKVSS